MFDKKLQIFIIATFSFLIMAFLIIIGNSDHPIEIAGFKISLAASCSLALIALLSYHTTISLDNYAKTDASLTEGVVRNAITATFIVMYIAYFSFALNGKFGNGNLTENFTTNLTYLTSVVVGFYFGSKIASELINKIKP